MPDPNAILNFLRSNAAPAMDMWRNSETGLANATQQFNERASGDLNRYFGVNAGPDTVSLLTALMGGVKAPGQPPRIANPIKAYHGSPYDFNEFDLSKIGSGEGAQAYGHGLYFAESEPVAKSYRDDLSAALYNGKPYDVNDPTHLAANYLEQNLGNRSEAIEDLHDLAKHSVNANDTGGVSLARAAADALKNGTEAKSGAAGHMYEVALHATPESFLDWDKPLSQQPQAVRDFVAKNHPEAIANNPNMTGAGVWKGSDVIGGRTPEGQSEAANKLREAGIPGVRYLDQLSRGAHPPGTPERYAEDALSYVKGDRQGAARMLRDEAAKSGNEQFLAPLSRAADLLESSWTPASGRTHNYSVWTPEIIEILRKYGIIAAPAAGAVANAISQPQQSQQQ